MGDGDNSKLDTKYFTEKRFPNFFFLQFAMQSEDLTKKKGAWKSGVFEKDIKTKL